MPSGRRHAGRLGLRSRAALYFALVASLVSLVLAVSVLTTSESYMLGQRERSVQRQATIHADYVRTVLASSGSAAADSSAARVISSLDLPAETMLLLRWEGQWFGSTASIGPESVPAELAEASAGGPSPAVNTTIGDKPYLAVVVAVTTSGDRLYQFSPLSELQSTLRALQLVIVACALAATASGAILGWWASRRVLTPLHTLADTASRIAGGELSTRLADTRDPDLVTIVASFNSMVDSLQQRIERERRFFGDVSHELRTPLTTLLTSVEVLVRHERDLPERSRRAVDLISAEVHHLHRLLEDLLALARSEAGLHQDELESISVRDLLTYTLADSKRPADLLTGGDVAISGRKLALERAFLNLLDNADRHGGGVTGVSVHAEGQSAVVTVDDTGPGVPEGERDRVFERFATTHTGRKSTAGTGTGLGLALVAETIAAHNGHVRCTERPGGGARFIVTLPSIPSEARHS